MSAEPRRPLAIVVVSYASSGLLSEHLVASARSVAPELVVVVDNLSSSDERERVLALAQRHGWQVVTPERNLGFGGGVNCGVARARALGARDLLVLNPDAQIESAAVAALRAAADADGLAVLAPVIRDPQGGTWSAGSDLYVADGATRGRARRAAHADAERWEWLSGACLWIPEEAWELVGGFDEDYFLYWEDVDLSRRLVERGGRLRVVEDAVAVHDEGGTHRERGQLGRGKSSVYTYYNIRNRMLFAVKHLDAQGVRRWRRGVLGAAWEVLGRSGRRQLLRSPAPVRAALRGVVDARRIVRESAGVR
ncbi:glycosyltransferase [Agrococcus sediminis]|uniref:glycosyltransferase n=1 Tax=Agrococcus sediminis TaxID=2599924 RepID=UPI0037F9FB62